MSDTIMGSPDNYTIRTSNLSPVSDEMLRAPVWSSLSTSALTTNALEKQPDGTEANGRHVSSLTDSQKPRPPSAFHRPKLVNPRTTHNGRDLPAQRVLVHSLFEARLPLQSAIVTILRHFIALKLVSVKAFGDQAKLVVDGNDLVEAAILAAVEDVLGGRSSSVNKFIWTWSSHITHPQHPSGSLTQEQQQAFFFNCVGTAAYTSAVFNGLLTPEQHPQLRFYAPPQSDLPLSYRNEQGCQPDVIGMKCGAFSETAGDVSKPVFGNHYKVLKDNFPGLFNGCFEASPETSEARSRSLQASPLEEFKTWYLQELQKEHVDLSQLCWPEAEFTMEMKNKDRAKAVWQALNYMRQQRRSQPWQCFVLGFFLTSDSIGILRGDPAGVEQQILEKRQNGAAVLETIRLALGLLTSTPQERGQHPAFALSVTSTPNPAALKSTIVPVSPSNSKSRSSNSERKDPIPSVFNHRRITFIQLDDKMRHPSAIAQSTTRFYVHYLIEDRGSLTGRSTRVFCVSRLTHHEPDDYDVPPELFSMEEKKGDCYVGTYVLKWYYAPRNSDSYESDVIQIARKALHGKPHRVLLPLREWRMASVLRDIRRYEPEQIDRFISACKSDVQQAREIIPGVEAERVEVFAMSHMKRTLFQVGSFSEYKGVIKDVIHGIQDLWDAGLVHRDISFGNILLAAETENPGFFEEAQRRLQPSTIIGRVGPTFRQRECTREEGGLLHDLDLAACCSHVATNPDPFGSPYNGPWKAMHTGTAPFMAANVLLGGVRHAIEHDLESVFYVAYLLPMTLKEKTMTRYPERAPMLFYDWPREVQDWSHPKDGAEISAMGMRKLGYFIVDSAVRAIYKTGCKAATESDSKAWWENDPDMERLVLKALYPCFYTLPKGSIHRTQNVLEPARSTLATQIAGRLDLTDAELDAIYTPISATADTRPDVGSL